MGPSDTVFLGYLSWVIWWVVCPLLLLVEPWLLFAHHWEGLALGLISYEDWLVKGWPYWAGFTLAGLWSLPSLHFGYVILGCSPGWYSSSGRNWPLGMLAAGPPGRSPDIGQVQPHPVPCPGQPGESHQAIHRWPPPMLDLKVPQEAKRGTTAGCL